MLLVVLLSASSLFGTDQVQTVDTEVMQQTDAELQQALARLEKLKQRVEKLRLNLLKLKLKESKKL